MEAAGAIGSWPPPNSVVICKTARSSGWAATEHRRTSCVGPTIVARRSSSLVRMRVSAITSCRNRRLRPPLRPPVWAVSDL